MLQCRNDFIGDKELECNLDISKFASIYKTLTKSDVKEFGNDGIKLLAKYSADHLSSNHVFAMYV